MIEFIYAYAYFIIYAFLGWVCEDLYCGIPKQKFINRGFFYGPYCPIYGVGALLVLYPLLFVKQYPILVFILGLLITSVLEYFTSWIMEKLFKTRWWDYSKHKFNLNGRVCLLNSTLFGCMSIVVVYLIHPIIEDFVQWIPMMALTSLLSAFTIGFSIDCVFTVIALLRRKKVFEKVQAEMEEIKQEFESESHLRAQEAQEVFQEWLQSKYERLEQLQGSMNSISLEAKKHIAKAFPEKTIQKDVRDWLQNVERRLSNRGKAQLCCLSSCILIDDEFGRVLTLENEQYPGGNIAIGEDFIDSNKRLVKEQTGLDVESFQLIDINQWMEKNYRHIEFIYKANTYEGNLKQGVTWISKNKS